MGHRTTTADLHRLVLLPLLINVNISEPETFNDDKHVAFLHVKLYGLMLYIPELLIFII